MHHFIFPSQDTYISNQGSYPNKNFGLDEILVIGTDTNRIVETVTTKSFSYNNEIVTNWCVDIFSGSITGSLTGTASYITGSGSGTGSFGTSSFSGSIITGSNFTGSVVGFTGLVSQFDGRITGTVSGKQYVSQSSQITTITKHVNRALVKFDVSEISESISLGEISSPQFTLKLFIARAENMPLDYTVYALPISQSWEMGNGYSSDGGSSKGASWLYRNYDSGTFWYPYTNSSSFTPIDFISSPMAATESWARGGSTWYTNSIASQSFSYESGDVSINVSDIVYRWLSGSIPNNGFLLISSDELESTGSEMGLYFFSKDSNTIYQPILDVGWNDSTWVTGSVSTGSVSIVTLPPGLLGTAKSGSTISGSSINGLFNGTVNLITTASGVIVGNGISGSILSMSFFGNITYENSSSYSSSITQSFIVGTITSGDFSASVFTSSIDNVTLNSGRITGSWNYSSLSGSIISASYPFSLSPNIIVTLTGNEVNGTAFGTWETSTLTSGSFTGVMISGPQIGARVYIPFTGSILTSSYSYTSSVTMSSSSLEPVQFNVPFTSVLQNIPPVIKSGNVIRVNVFAREEFPFKNFQRRTQFTQYVTPRYLPTASYYAIKDNETEQNVLDFDNYTQLSCDTNGNYFMLDTTGFAQERYYRLLIRTEQSGSIYTFDKGNIFKIVR